MYSLNSWKLSVLKEKKLLYSEFLPQTQMSESLNLYNLLMETFNISKKLILSNRFRGLIYIYLDAKRAKSFRENFEISRKSLRNANENFRSFSRKLFPGHPRYKD